MADPVIMWCRQDLRHYDHAALAAERAGPVIAVYVRDDAACGAWAPSGASRRWLHHCLQVLDVSLRAFGSRLVLRRGPTIDALLAIVSETGARRLHVSRACAPYAASLEHKAQALAEAARLRALAAFAWHKSGSIAVAPRTWALAVHSI